ncbi:hypothetical protein [Marinoscillum sp.]|uniref:hypothetical protein n=1 Tax=Marinoscillum sp. TaxID=2024838 RepID=UPI003BAAC771
MKIVDQSLEDLINIAEDAVFDGNYQQAYDLLQSGLYEEPGYPKLHYTLAWFFNYYSVNKLRAERHYMLTIKFDPEYEDAYGDLVDIHINAKRYQYAKNILIKALTVESLDQVMLRKKLGVVYEKLGDYINAMKEYRIAMMESTDNDDSAELKKDVKRIRMKRFKTIFRKWQPQS